MSGAGTHSCRLGAFPAVVLLCAIVAICNGSESRAADAAQTMPRWRGVPVLMYHRVDARVPRDAVGRDLTVEPRAFATQLRLLQTRHIATITAAALVQRLARGERPGHVVVLTFDDGYDDAATTALPLLRRYGARATFYISSGFIGTPGHVTWYQLRALRDAGMEVACHGTFHLDLSTLDRAGQEREAAGCMQRFARYLGPPAPTTYAYPAGKFDATTFTVMHQLGVRAAFTERPGNVDSLQDPFALPRLRVRHDDDLAQFAALVSP